MFHEGNTESKVDHQNLYWSHLRKSGQGSDGRHICSNRPRKMCFSMCCQCFCQYGKDIGIIKVD
ncbi:40S ribosomal protein S29-like [Mustela erminea]|uniref:40S ribosomal protein S29-like n=1 Tax=Mustela erminea TaxID=36723 RepID=UPI001387118B|nr:40S ribosomal protein S29-like [Mustela erminea]